MAFERGGKMRKATVAIFDQDAIQRDRIAGLLQAVPGLTVLKEQDIPTWRSRKTSRTANILLVNVQQARRNELILADGAKQNVAIIALADSPEAALEAFNVRAIDCLLKPVQEAAVLRALQRAFDYLELRRPKPIPLRANRSGKKYLRQVRVTKGDAVLFVPAEQILWIEAQDNYVRIHTDDQVFMERGRISSYEASLDPEQFLRVNRSAIVNVRQIQELRSMFKGAYSVILRDGSRISMSRSIEELEKRLSGFPSDLRRQNEPVSAEFARD
jgi:two-component system, LytTR family, response regulator